MGTVWRGVGWGVSWAPSPAWTPTLSSLCVPCLSPRCRWGQGGMRWWERGEGSPAPVLHLVPVGMGERCWDEAGRGQGCGDAACQGRRGWSAGLGGRRGQIGTCVSVRTQGAGRVCKGWTRFWYTVMESVCVQEPMACLCQGVRGCARVQGEGRWGAVGARGGCGVTGSPARTSCLKEAPRVGTEPPMGAVCARAQALRVCMLLLEERVWAVPSAVGSLRLAPEGSASGSCLPAWRRRQLSVQLPGVRGGDPAWDHILLQG